ncbi:hypothetical protein As57867_018518, partial [Aphanomyces stellatus]
SAVVLAAAATSSVQAFWDNGHQMVGEIASQLLDPKDLATINSLLQDWEEAYPNTAEVTTATIWADLIKCDSVSATYCPSAKKPSVKYTDDWHYIDLPMNVNGTDWNGLTSKDLDKLIQASIDGRGLNTLREIFKTMAKTHSKWSANWVLRFFLHVFGDIHQPLHATAGISEKFPGGDAGGNFHAFLAPCVSTNLHAMWDSAAGAYTNNWYPDSVPGSPARVALAANATKLLSLYGKDEDKLNFAQYASLTKYSDFAAAITKDKAIEKVFTESYDVSRTVVYIGLDYTWLGDKKDKIACPSAEYQAKVVATIEPRMVLAGRRMAVALAQFARQLRAQGLAQ